MSTTGDQSQQGRLPVVVELPGGRRLTVRTVLDEDVPGIRLLYEHLSTEDLHRRFFVRLRVTDAFVQQWVHRCREHGLGLVAVVDEGRPGTTLVADAGYVLLPNGDGEFAITVAREWRGWLGPYLLDLLVGVAAARGVPNLEADILTENATMLSLVRRRGYVTDGDQDFSVVHVVIGTAGGRPVWPDTGQRRRILVEVPGGRWSHRREVTRAGFEVLACGGPDDRCPALAGRPCPLAEAADVILVALAPSDERTRALLGAHARLHPGVPVVVQAGGARAGDPASPCELASGATSADVIAAIRDAVRRTDDDEEADDEADDESTS